MVLLNMFNQSSSHVVKGAPMPPMPGNFRKKESDVNVVPLERQHQSYDYEEVR